jgi:orotidine-5'-phosphate decarboxylase
LKTKLEGENKMKEEERNFRQMLEKLWAQKRFVCIGLDSEYNKIPQHIKDFVAEGKENGLFANTEPIDEVMFRFNKNIIDATANLVCAYKPNIAFYEEQGTAGISALIRTIEYIKLRAPEVPIILDAKRADIGNTNQGYVRSTFKVFGADAITVHPYLGAEALQPFLDQKNKGIVVLCRTSNPGAGEFQDLEMNGEPLYQIVARKVTESWNNNGNCAVVVGATYPEELEQVRRIVGHMPILIPGVGAQGADVEKTVKAGGREIIVNISRGAIFASNGADYAQAARRETIKLNDSIVMYMVY